MRKFAIATASSRKATIWRNQSLSIDQLHKAITTTYATSENFNEYAAMPKAKRDDIKDVGGFVGGYLEEGRRRAGFAKSRSLITLDADNAKQDFDFIFEFFYNCRAWIYSTHSHTEEKPRYRLVIPLSRDVDSDEYAAITLKMMETLGMNQFDWLSYQPERLMYWASHSKDIKPIICSLEGELLNPDDILSQYEDWRDTSQWPIRIEKLKIPSDPKSKPGIIGAFCRCYDVEGAMEKFLPGTYHLEREGRYTFSKGSTFGGMVIYDNGNFAYSNHATDPISGKLVNAFDLIRIHKFSELDHDSPPDTPANRLPSYIAARDFILEDEGVRKLIATEKIKEAGEDFQDNVDWLADLRMDKSGNIQPNAKNLELIFDNDPNLAGLAYLDEFTQRYCLSRAPIWKGGDSSYWTDFDFAALRVYIDKTYSICGRDKIRDAWLTAVNKNTRHPVKEYLNSLQWDGKKRVETLLVDYLGAEDCEYTRTVTRKFLIAAVSRIYEPGCKFDYTLVTAGKQGIGKTLLPDKLAGKWFCNSLETVRGREAYEAIEGSWIIEMGEMTATKRAEVEAVKHFISKREDKFRRPYGETTFFYPRQCVFWGTTNEKSFLQDKTGNRRFWVVVCHGNSKYKVWHMTQETVDQIWAEVVLYYQMGEELTLDERLEKMAEEMQERHSRGNEISGVIDEYVNDKDNPRDRICIAEVIVDCLGGNLSSFPIARKGDIIAALDAMEGWERYGKNLRFGVYGTQKAWVRVTPNKVESDPPNVTM